jgi:hypothetical protein
VKELRLAGANDIQAGNALLPAFMADYNRRFAKPARNDKDLHRPFASQDDLDGSFAWRVERTVTQSLTVPTAPSTGSAASIKAPSSRTSG